MAIHPLAGQPAPPELLLDVTALIDAYYQGVPDLQAPTQRVSFGTSGHRGSAFDTSFNETHILAITQAICDYRVRLGITGPLMLGMDTHALSQPAHDSALEVLAANGVQVMLAVDGGYTPTPLISHAIISYNRAHPGTPADGIVVTPSHNPPEDGGFKYNPPHGGPADGQVTGWIEARANALMGQGLQGVKRVPLAQASKADTTHAVDFITPYVEALGDALDMDAVGASGLKIGVDPMGGAGIACWEPIASRYGLDLDVVNTRVDPRFAFMPLDKDGKIRMDCSSPWAMANLIELRDRFDIGFGNDTDYDRHGIVTRSTGLLNPNHYLAVAVEYLFTHRPEWSTQLAIGKTLVTSSIVDRVAAAMDRPLAEVPVGFKWFVEGLSEGRFGFAGEESAGASFLRRDGRVWTTDKDGILLDLLAVEITAITGRDPGERYVDLTARLGEPIYERISAPANAAQKSALKGLSPEDVNASDLAGEPIRDRITRSAHGDAPIGGLKVVTDNGWFAARPSGTESVYKIYAESFKGADHLKRIQREAQDIVGEVFERAGLSS